jgi:glycosyltransferase involved in cell wall biosynthesis
MVADYPQKDATHSNAKAPYAKNLVLALKENDVRLTIIANRLEGSRNAYAEKGVRIVRCWQKGLFCLFQIVRQLWRLRAEIDVIHFQHEYFYYGGAVTAALFPFMLLLLKVLGKPILVTLHGVISISDFGGTFARQNRLKGNPRLLMSGLLIVTKLMGLFADRLIVHEDFLADTLAQEYGIKRKKIRTIHHGIQEGLPGDGAEIRKRLEINGRKALLFFGYFSGYKGLHILIDAFTKLEDRNTMLIVAGEENPRMTADRSYRAYIRRLKSQAATLGDRIAFVGFVPEKEMPMYFAAADVVVLPYTSVVSACGPLTQCVTYRRPFLLSEPFEKVVSRHAFLFKAEPELLRRKIEEFFADGKLAKEALDCAEKLARERSWGESGRQTAGIYRELCSK